MINYIFIFILGTIFASFLHLYVTRTLKGESIVKPRSHCTNCNHTLKWYELFPILSYIIQKGKCKKCGAKIGLDSLIVEIITGILFILSYHFFKCSYETIIACIIVLTLISICISDFKEMVILDSTLITSIISVYLVTFIFFGWRGVYHSFMYGVFAFVLMFIIKIIGDKVFNRESLGGGDIKLAFLMGSILQYDLFLFSIMISSSIALPYALFNMRSSKNHEFAFGPFLVIGLYIVFLFKDVILKTISDLVL